MKVNKNVLILIGLIILSLFFIISKKEDPKISADTNNTIPTIETKGKQIVVGLQAGHWLNDELPQELSNLRNYGGGSKVGTVYEWEVNLDIAQRAAKILEKENIKVDILPATIPEDYRADAFLTIHADGNDDTGVSGFRVAASDYDRSDRAEILSQTISDNYRRVTKLPIHPNIEQTMTRYYGFNFVSYHSSIDPRTPAAMIETGFLTNSRDRNFLTSSPELAAQGIAEGLLGFLETN